MKASQIRQIVKLLRKEGVPIDEKWVRNHPWIWGALKDTDLALKKAKAEEP